jgi:lipoprotein-anchoring transpeptidase ErfK/SrfK
MKTGSKIKFVISLCLVGVVLLPGWKQFLSKQGKIDPENIKDEYDENAKWGIFNNNLVEIPERFIDNETKILGENTNETEIKNNNKRIEVDLTNQTTSAYEGDKLIYQFLVSTGSWNKTPTGEFSIWTKVRKQKMSGGSKELGTYYYLPNVQYVMFFYNDKVPKMDGYSFHEAYWHNNFGVPMSHGCINMKLDDSRLLYEWADIGTKINIFGKYKTILPKI